MDPRDDSENKCRLPFHSMWKNPDPCNTIGSHSVARTDEKERKLKRRSMGLIFLCGRTLFQSSIGSAQERETETFSLAIVTN